MATKQVQPWFHRSLVVWGIPLLLGGCVLSPLALAGHDAVPADSSADGTRISAAAGLLPQIDLIAMGRSVPSDLPQAAKEAPATLEIAVRWPRPTSVGQALPEGLSTSGRQAESLPNSTNLLVMTVTSASGSPVISPIKLSRGSGGTLVSTASAILPGGSEYLVDARAYSTYALTAQSLVLAEGTASIQLEPNTRTPLAISLVPAYPPTVATYTPSGGPQSTVTISGNNFLPPGTAAGLTLTLAGEDITNFGSMGDTLLSFSVPSDASSGPLVLKADGLTATGLGNFQVLRSLALTPASIRNVVPGSSVVFTASATDSMGIAVASPSLTWSFTPPATWSLSTGGAFLPATQSANLFTPLGTGTFTVMAQSGTVLATASVSVQ
ncbi:MAG: hypothetical protein KGR26_07955 [Cyanobacteria bacterium REEB65]|nr:hypothetical protein [Cyanobacteria bacterium REEB65]